MKKLKLLPTFFMLVLCVGVLAIGIYAITPTKNTISGNVSIGASNSPVALEVIKGSTTLKYYESVRSGQTINFGDLSFFDDGDAQNVVADSKEIKLSIKVTNIGTKTVGAYYADLNNNDITETNPYADGTDDVIVVKEFKEDSNIIATARMSSYTPIAVGKTVEMIISVTLTNFPLAKQEYDLGLVLFVEEYIATENYSTSANKLIKLPETSATTINLANDIPQNTIVAIPDGVSFEEVYQFMKCATLVARNIPTTQTTCNMGSIMDFVIIPSYVTSFNSVYAYADGTCVDINMFIVSEFNTTYSNDSLLRLYNKNKSTIYASDVNHLNYLPSSVTAVNGVCGGLDNTGEADLSDTNISNFTLCYGQGSLTLVFPEGLTEFKFSTIASPNSAGSMNLTFKTQTPPTITGSIGQPMQQLQLTVPEGGEQAYATAFKNLDNDIQNLQINGTAYKQNATWLF